MISFVWMSNYPFLAGTGGSENYTAGHIRELQKRGIDANIITIGLGENDGREDFPDITFKAIRSVEELSKIDAILVFVIYPLAVKTKYQSYVILHCPLSLCDQEQSFLIKGTEDKKLIAPSHYASELWADHFNRSGVPVVYPFADKAFAQVMPPKRTNKKVRILFAGRLTPDKGVYTLMAALHFKMLHDLDFELTATSACDHSIEGQLVRALFEAHPLINVVPARKTPQAMAQLMAEHDIVVMPTTDQFWHEAFGIVSVEAQHAGCRVVASNAGGLPETDCGGLILVEPDNPLALAKGIVEAAKKGRLSLAERAKAVKKFTVEKSVDTLLQVMKDSIKVVQPRSVAVPSLHAHTS
jgi:glycosyltransferase involved in cell wall biosynthesis